MSIYNDHTIYNIRKICNNIFSIIFLGVQKVLLVMTKKPSYRKSDKIKQTLKEWNTIEGVELYAPLYQLYNKLFLATQNRKLECLDYYIDIERNSENEPDFPFMYAEIKGTWELPLKDRYKLHLQLMKRVLSNDKTLVYSDDNYIRSEEEGQLTLFN